MFNFHKPRTYRSAEGCCICRAKSSSSRFTDSRKYERDTMLCFDLKYPRQGEICNACVLLVKRFKRLPVGSKRNWSHVVDARAGPGGSKIQTKNKSDRISSRAPTSPSLVNNTTHGNGSSTVTNNNLSYMPEKFSKIFKKSKKLKDCSSSSSMGSYSSSPSASLSLAKQRKSSHNGWSQSTVSMTSLPTTPDSLDSDYEDYRNHHGPLAGSAAAGTVVQFQTQTRASAFKAQAAAEARRRLLKLGSKRRKCLQPRKYRVTDEREEGMQFFDEEEWREQKSCCGMLYECPALGGALIVDVANYKPCEKHRPLAAAATAPSQQMLKNDSTKEHHPTSLVVPGQRSIIQTMPAVVQLQPPQSPAFTLSLNSVAPNNNVPSPASSLTITKTSTPVLKKHHLFFKRQSECFPQGDMVVTQNEAITATNNYSNIIAPPVAPSSKTESSDYQNQTHSITSATKLRHSNNEHAIQTTNTGATSSYSISSSAALSISVTHVAAGASSLSASAPTMPSSFSLPTTSTSSYACSMPQMPKHSLAKVTTISPPLTASHMTSTCSTSLSAMPLTKAQHNSSFSHRIKSDTGKIVKHSLEKFNTAVRLKSSDILHDMKPIIKTVDKSYILAKPAASGNINTLNNIGPATTNATYQTLSTYNSATGQPPLTTTTSLSAASPTSSTSSTSSTKFSDNSSDSGFDENMLDRKSASPLQEDCEKKLLSRPGVQTMFLASGVQIQGQPQNLMLTGNEVAAKILQNRKYSSITTTTSMGSSNAGRSFSINHPTTTAVKIAQISTGSGIGGHHTSAASVMSSAAQAKMRAIYNNSNTIQHENGITTIVPASSLAATTQTAAMQNIAPSTVTITPAPLAAANAAANQYSAQSIISRKLTAANIINLQSNNLSNNTTHLNSNHHSGVIGNHLMNTSAASSGTSAATANQKIILLKTSSQQHHHQQQPQNSMAAASVKYNQTSITGSSGGNGSMMGGR